jgi:hypothetical protein
MPCGVHGMSADSPIASLPALSGFRPSTSLCGRIRESRDRESRWSGNGSCIKNPETALSSLRRSTTASISSWEAFSGKQWACVSIPTSAQSVCLLRT